MFKDKLNKDFLEGENGPHLLNYLIKEYKINPEEYFLLIGLINNVYEEGYANSNYSNYTNDKIEKEYRSYKYGGR